MEDPVSVEDSASVTVRQATVSDFDAWFALFDAVAREGKWIGREGPLDRESSRLNFEQYIESEDRTTFLVESVGLVESEGKLLGLLGIEVRRGLAEFGMMVDSASRGEGVGSLLMESCIEWARERGCHKIALQVWPHNQVARSLYRKFGFVEESHLHRHYRRQNGELWDAIGMGLILDRESPSSPYGS
jgi:RimJ/RimL family protein N-acetyltransferase